MKLHELTTPYETYKLIKYSQDGNTVIKRNTAMQQICGTLYKGEAYNEYGTEYCTLYAVYPEYGIAYTVDGHIDTRRETEELFSRFTQMPFCSPSNFIMWMDGKTDIEKDWIRDAELELAAYFMPDRVPIYREIKSAMQRYREEKQAREAEERRQAEQKFVTEQNAIAEETVAKAIETIKSGGKLDNDTVTFYKSVYDCSKYSIINHLMRQYRIKVPLRTQGWINDKLKSMTIADGKCEHCTFWKSQSGKCSETFWKCINKLITAVNSAEK